MPWLCATDLTLPPILSGLVHHVFQHSVHHAHPGIPAYRIPEAQSVLNAMLGGRGVSEPMSLKGALATLRACKLYDFDKGQWTDFNGRPTTTALGAQDRCQRAENDTNLNETAALGHHSS